MGVTCEQAGGMGDRAALADATAGGMGDRAPRDEAAGSALADATAGAMGGRAPLAVASGRAIAGFFQQGPTPQLRRGVPGYPWRRAGDCRFVTRRSPD